MKKRSWESRILSVLFFGPPVLVALAIFGPWELGWLPQVQLSYGERYKPPFVLPESPLKLNGGGILESNWARGGWSLIYADLSDCSEDCLRSLSVLESVQLAASDEIESIQVVYLYGAKDSASMNVPGLPGGLIIGRIEGPTAAPLREVLGEKSLVKGRIYIVNPSGKLVFSYPPDAEEHGVLRDLKRLIALNRIV
jgi:hypothetical protein